MYNHKLIEKKWQDFWEENKTFKTTESNERKNNIYVLDMFPYPSGAGLHVGHIEGYSATDAFARYKRLNGFNVLHPIGWDAFGLPAEQYALETKNHPSAFTHKNIQNFRVQLKSMGFSYDYDKEVDTTDPDYYKWTQWIFIQLYKKGLAEYKEVNVNWCPALGTVLANEEIVQDNDGNDVSERGGYPVEQKPMKQWVLKITQYAKELVNDLNELNWPSSLISLQKNWIGLEIKNGKETTKLRDWIFSRQRFWGEPFPIAFDHTGEIYLVEELPVTLPKDAEIKPAHDGTSPLSNIPEWVNFKHKNIDMKRETNTMPQWAGSSWYYLAYILKTDKGYIPLGTKEAFEKLEKWLPVDLYVGGQEHAVLHLLYARFWHKVLYDLNVVPTKEPFFRIVNQGMILGEDGQKMSKSKGNGINPDEIINEYGADSLRVYELFMAAITDDKPWSPRGINAIYKWIERVYVLFESQIGSIIKITKETSVLEKELNICIQKVTQDLEELKFNTAISQLMILQNAIFAKKEVNYEIIEKFLVMLSPFAPHLSDELLYKYFKKDASKFRWPKYDPSKILESEKIIVVQVRGKLRGTLIYSIEQQLIHSQILADALKIPRVIQAIGTKKVLESIYLKDKLINIIIE